MSVPVEVGGAGAAVSGVVNMADLRKLYGYGLVILVALALGVVLVVFVPKFERLHVLGEKKAALSAENRQLEEAIHELQNRQARFLAESDAVERTAHEANMVKPDEVVFRFTTGTTSAVEGRLP